MKIKFALLLTLLVSFQETTAQESGYFGKKTMIEFGGMGQLPLFQNVFGEEKGYGIKNNELKPMYNLIDYSFRFSLSGIIDENTALGLEFTQRYYAINPMKLGGINRQYVDGSGSVISNDINANVAYIPVSEQVFMPKITFSSNQTRVPAGLSHEFGIGYSTIHLREKHPVVQVQSGPFTNAEIQDHFVDDQQANLKGLVFLYGIRMNYPISKNLLLNVGVRYQYNHLIQKKKYQQMDDSDYWFSGREIWSRLNQRRQLGFFNLGAGLIFCL